MLSTLNNRLRLGLSGVSAPRCAPLRRRTDRIDGTRRIAVAGARNGQRSREMHVAEPLTPPKPVSHRCNRSCNRHVLIIQPARLYCQHVMHIQSVPDTEGHSCDGGCWPSWGCISQTCGKRKTRKPARRQPTGAYMASVAAYENMCLSGLHLT